MSDDRINIQFGAVIGQALAGLEEMGAATKETVDSMKADLASLTAVADTVMAPFIAIGALLAGGEIFKEAISKTADLGVSLQVMSDKTGISVEELSRLQYAAQASHVSTEALETGMQRLARAMEQAEKGTGPAADAMKRLGISVTDVNGHARPLQEVLLDLAAKFATIPDGATKTAAAMDLFGRSGANMIPFLDQGREGIAALEAEADKLGITMSGDAVETAVQYEEAMHRLTSASEGAERAIAIGLMPALTSIANALKDAATQGGLWNTIGEVTGDVFRIIATMATIAATELRIYFDIAKDVVHLKNPWQDITRDAQQAGQVITDLWTKLANGPPAPKKQTGGDDVAPKGLTEMEQFQKQWLQIEEGQTQHFGALTAMELKFWRDKLALVDANSKDYLEIQRRIVALEQEMAKQGYEEQLAQLRAQEAADKDNKARVLADRQQELDLIRQHYDEASKEVQDGIARVNEAQVALQNETAKGWKDAADAIPKAFSEATKQVGKNVTTMHDFFRSFFDDLLRMSLTTSAGMLRDHLATELAKRHITLQTAVEKVASETWGALRTAAIHIAESLGFIHSEAAKAAASTFSATASVPVVGPVAAPAAAAGAMAAVLAFAGDVASAAGGYDIPAGLNPVTQLHSQEMVLPAELSNRIRSMTSSGSSGENHVHVHGVDAVDIARWARRPRNQRAIGAAAVAHVRAGGRL